MVLSLRVLTTFAEDPSLIRNSHVAAHNHFQEIQNSLLDPEGIRYACSTQNYMQAKLACTKITK